MFRAQSQGVTISLLGIVIAFQLYKKFSLKRDVVMACRTPSPKMLKYD